MRDYAALQCGEAKNFICSSAIVWKKTGGKKVNQFVCRNYKLDEFIFLLDVMNSVYDKVNANETNRKVL